MGFEQYLAPFVTGPGTFPFSFPCSLGRVVVRFTAHLREVTSALGPGVSTFSIPQRSPDILLGITKQVQFEVETNDQGSVSAQFSVTEFLSILDGNWPNDGNYSRIMRAIRDKKNYPMPESEIPGGGDKSKLAQGQTKKPGSHSHYRHH